MIDPGGRGERARSSAPPKLGLELTIEDHQRVLAVLPTRVAKAGSSQAMAKSLAGVGSDQFGEGRR